MRIKEGARVRDNYDISEKKEQKKRMRIRMRRSDIFAFVPRGSRVASAWVLRGFYVASAWLVRGFCVASAWRLRGFCVVGTWLLRDIGRTSARFYMVFFSIGVCLISAWVKSDICGTSV